MTSHSLSGAEQDWLDRLAEALALPAATVTLRQQAIAIEHQG